MLNCAEKSGIAKLILVVGVGVVVVVVVVVGVVVGIVGVGSFLANSTMLATGLAY